METPGASCSPYSNPSPKTVAASTSNPPATEYFLEKDTNPIGGSSTSAKTSEEDGLSERKSSIVSLSTAAEKPRTVGFSPSAVQDEWQIGDSEPGRKLSTSSVTIRLPRNPSLPQGTQRQTDGPRRRNASPPPTRFQNHVGFDNLPIGEATKNNTPSFTLTVKHKGYRAGRRSRTFMVGVDEHAYSDYALQWLLDELVDDGDEIVCVRVVEKDVRFGDKQYQDEGKAIMQNILDKNGANRALSFVLEYAIGKLHGTFQKLIQIHQPAMLIVGTRGRSLGGIQGLVNTRNSFSKYCLQYSPVPVVVVRPTEKRLKKKTKRANDSSRQTYLSMLAASQGRHEADSEASSTYELEVQISPDEEAHQVAKVLGLPASFDPTIKPLNVSHMRAPRASVASSLQNTTEASEEDGRALQPPPSESSDDDDDEADGGFEVMDGKQALDLQKREELHKMEVGEAAALRMPVDEDDDSEDETAGQKPSTS